MTIRPILATIAIAGGVIVPLTTAAVAQQHYTVGTDQTTTFGNAAPVLNVGDSVTVLEGASIIVAGGSGIVFQSVGSNEILNLGTVAVLGLGDRAIQLRSSPNSSITNAGVVTSTGRALYAFDSSNSTITNLGEVTTTAGGAGLLLFSSPDSALTNRGTVTTSGGGAHGLHAINSQNAQLLNAGAIVADSDDTYGMFVLGSAASSLLNSGTIQTGGMQWSDGMVGRDSPNTRLTNDGTITVPGSVASGIVVYNSTDSHLVNNGTINMVGAGGAAPVNLTGVLVHDNSHNTTIENNGTINVSGVAEAIEIVGSLGVVTYNRGMVTASGPDAVGYWSMVPGTLINSGTIFAGSPAGRAIAFPGGETVDTLSLLAGTRLQGTIDLGGGADTVTLNRSGDSVGWRFTLENFDEAAGQLVVTGGHYAIERSDTSTTVTIANITPHEGATSKLAVLASGVGQGVLDQMMLRGGDTRPTVWGAALGAGLNGSQFGGAAFGADASTPDGTVRLGAFAGAGQSAATGADFGYETDEVYGGLYGRLVGEDRYFADLVTFGGQGQGASTPRQVANNLVAGGLETISGGDNSGTYVAIRARVGASIPLTFGMLVPALTLGYAQETRRGYVETGNGGLAVHDHMARVLDARFALTALIAPDAMGGRVHLGASGGLDLAIDLSDPVVFDMAGANFSLPGHSGVSRGNWFVGANVKLDLSEALHFNATVDLLADAWNSGSGARVSLGVVGAF